MESPEWKSVPGLAIEFPRFPALPAWAPGETGGCIAMRGLSAFCTASPFTMGSVVSGFARGKESGQTADHSSSRKCAGSRRVLPRKCQGRALGAAAGVEPPPGSSTGGLNSASLRFWEPLLEKSEVGLEGEGRETDSAWEPLEEDSDEPQEGGGGDNPSFVPTCGRPGGGLGGNCFLFSPLMRTTPVGSSSVLRLMAVWDPGSSILGHAGNLSGLTTK